MYKIFITLICIIHTITFVLAQDNIFPINFNTNAEYAYMVDYESGEVLYDKNGNVPMTPSSMTKIMTSYIAFAKLKDGRLKLSDKFTISDNASKKVKNSVFKNSTGWPDEGHVMSARDLAVLATKLIEDFPEHYHYHAIKQYSFNNISQNNRNTLIGSYGVDGIKTGKTDLGGYGIVASAKRDGRRLIVVINGLKSEKEREIEAKKLLDFGFSNFKNLILFKGQNEVVEADVIYGNLNQISLNVQGEIVITVPLEYDRMKDLLFLTQFKEPLEAPIKNGDVVGKLKIMNSKEKILIKEVDLLASTDVEESGIIKKVFQSIRYFF